MHIKFLTHGTGDPYRAVTYLLASRDHAGRPRAEVIVLRGNPVIVAEVAAGLQTVHRYTSGVISWSREDEPTGDEINAVINDFERTAFAGLDADQYSWCVVLHTDADGSKHVHVLAARVELKSGKSHNIAPPAWQRAFDPLRDFWNHTKGWARPDDPLRARSLQQGRFRQASLAANRKNEELLREANELGLHVSDLTDELAVEPDPKRQITDWLLEQIYLGEIDTRDDLLNALKKLGTLNRVGSDYVSIRLEGHPRPLRLKGAIYGDDFDAASIRDRVNQPQDKTPMRGPPDLQVAEQARRELEAAIERRAAYNRKRYPAPTPSPPPTPLPTEGDEDSPALITDKDHHDRTRNAVLQSLARAFQAARNSVRRFVTACASAVQSSELLSSAGHLAQRTSASVDAACHAVERASAAVQRSIDAANRVERSELINPVEQEVGSKMTVKPRA